MGYAQSFNGILIIKPVGNYTITARTNHGYYVKYHLSCHEGF